MSELFIRDRAGEQRDHLRRLAAAKLKPSREQQPCDVGLFSDEASQTDLVDMANRRKA